MRVALVFPGDASSPATRSGAPHGIARGLLARGADVVHVRAEPGVVVRLVVESLLTAVEVPKTALEQRTDVLRRSRATALCRPELSWVRSRSAHRRLNGSTDVDAVLQVGTGVSVPSGLPTVTYDDMTVVQAVRHGFSQWPNMSRRAVEARIKLQQAAYDQAAACCVEGRWAARSLVEDYGIPAEKIHVVGVGRNRDLPAPREKNWNRPRFLFVGRDWERKNGPTVVRAFRRLHRRVPEARLDLVGGHPPVDESGITGHGILRLDDPAERERLDRLFSLATCFVMPSLFEPFGIVFAEASAAGIPSIGTSVGGCADLLEGHGRVVDPWDEEALLAAMLQLSQPAVAERAGALARERAKDFTWPEVGGRILCALRGARPPRFTIGAEGA
jgi:glycosyltransferase involved in cell wall biosynthesis